MVAVLDETADYTQRMGEQPAELSIEEWDPPSVAYSRRAAWRTTTSVEQKEKTKDDEQQADYAREHAVKMEAELQKISDGILALMDKDLIPSESTGEPKVFYCMMKSNFYRYLAECAACDTKSKTAEDVASKLQKTVEVPRVQHTDKTIDAPVVMQQYIDKIIDVPVARQCQVLASQTVQKTVEVPQV